MSEYTTDQVRSYCAKRQRSLRIDHPDTRVEFVRTAAVTCAGGPLWAARGERWWVRVTRGDEVTFATSFVCVQAGPPDRCYWQPLDPAMVSELKYLGIEGAT